MTFCAVVAKSSPSNDDESHDESSETDGHSSPSSAAVIVSAEAECAAPALRVTASVLSTRKFQKMSDVFPEIYINSVTSERQSIKRLSLRSNGIHFRIQRITLLFDIGLKPQETA